MTVNIEDALLLALTQKGKEYVFGAEAAKTDANPAKFDCSELVEWSCNRVGIAMPDTAFLQWRTCVDAGNDLSVANGMRTRGALLFVGDGTGAARDAITHVAWSLGDGTTIEARGTKWGVGCWPSVNRFNFAGKVPGAAYTPAVVSAAKQPADRSVVRLKSRGPQVEYLQTVLRKLGKKNLDGRTLIQVDGVFGENTKAAVMEIQRWCGVTVDGEVGPTTWAIIDQLARG